MKRWAGWAFLALVLGLTAWGVWRNPGEKARPVYGVRAEAKTFVREVSGEGEVVGRVLRLAFANSGRVAEVYVAKGDRVQAGQTLARLENRELARQLDLARGRLRAARDERARLAAAHRTQKARLTAQIDE
ncbi:MAG TPA: biotin/lipoyl-binding protein, partial [Oceanithermus profundus]|nr:biotin/lipoyl-binding protein [Oceanithermus profundus]